MYNKTTLITIILGGFMKRVIRVESACIETPEKRKRRIDSFLRQQGIKDKKNSVSIPAGHLKSEKKAESEISI